MRIHPISDVHNEFKRYEPAPISADVVVLAGDIHEGTQGIEWARQAYPGSEVIYVAGNHEYYHGNLQETLQHLREAQCTRVHFLERDELVIGGVRFLGLTSWTDYRATGVQEAAKHVAVARMRDFERITICSDRRRPRTADFIELAEAGRAWLQEQLEKPFDGPTVVITHHAPSLRSLEGNLWLATGLHASYANNWDDLMEKATVWIHGHSHAFADYAAGRCRVICNPRGYPGQTTWYKPELIIEV